MKEWMIKAALSLVGEIIEKYVTEEMIDGLEIQAKKYAYEKLKELAASTEWTEVDDALVKVIGKAWGLI